MEENKGGKWGNYNNIISKIYLKKREKQSRKPKGGAKGRTKEYAQPFLQPNSPSKNGQNTFAFKKFPDPYSHLKDTKLR